MQIYTPIYSATGQFFIFTKPLKGYFFKNGAAIYSDGQDLNSGGNSALPGGRVEFLDKSLVAAGRREFIEECGGRFEFRSAPERLCLGQTSLRILNEAGQVFQAMVNSQNVQYAAYYFELGLEYLEALLDLMSRTEPTQGTLVQGVEAAQEIQAGTITNYAPPSSKITRFVRWITNSKVSACGMSLMAILTTTLTVWPKARKPTGITGSS